MRSPTSQNSSDNSSDSTSQKSQPIFSALPRIGQEEHQVLHEVENKLLDIYVQTRYPDLKSESEFFSTDFFSIDFFRLCCSGYSEIYR